MPRQWVVVSDIGVIQWWTNSDSEGEAEAHFALVTERPWEEFAAMGFTCRQFELVMVGMEPAPWEEKRKELT